MTPLPTSPWPRRAAWLAVLATFPIFLIGGTVTTLRVGMAVPDWPTTFGHNMFTYPLGEMLANTGVFWEHSHRLWGAFVGCTIVFLGLVMWRAEPRPLVRALALVAFLLVCLQGLLGGLRVTENSPQLAFVHGAAAQALFALLAGIVAFESRAVRAAAAEREPRLQRLALLAVGLVFLQTVLGAWLRHSGVHLALALHILLAVAATWSVLVLSRGLRAAREPALARNGRWLAGLVWAQVVLGVLAAVWVFVITGPHRPVSIGEAVFATAHVACGAVLLALCSTALVLSRAGAAGAARPAESGLRMEPTR